MECYDRIPPSWVQQAGLRPLCHNRRGATFGLPINQAERWLSILLAQNIPVTLIREQRCERQAIFERVPVWRYVPVAAGD